MTRPTKPALPLDNPARRRLPPLLRQAWYSLNQSFGRRLDHLGITPDQFTVLRWLVEGDRKGCTQRELAERMASDPNTISGVLGRMEQAGLIERVPHESDARAHRTRITIAGRRVYQSARKIAVELQAEVLTVLPAGERDRFLAQLEAVGEVCRQAALES